VPKHDFFIIYGVFQKKICPPDALIKMLPGRFGIFHCRPRTQIKFLNQRIDIRMVGFVTSGGEHRIIDTMKSKLTEKKGVNTVTGLTHTFVVDKYFVLSIIGFYFSIQIMTASDKSG